MDNIKKYFRLATAEARKAFILGYSPAGCVLVDGNEDKILLSVHSKRIPSGIFHAELLAMLEYYQGSFRTDNLNLFTALEPCVMCLCMAIVGRVKKVYWLLDDQWGGGIHNIKFSDTEYLDNRITLKKINIPDLSAENARMWKRYLAETDNAEFINKILASEWIDE